MPVLLSKNFSFKSANKIDYLLIICKSAAVGTSFFIHTPSSKKKIWGRKSGEIWKGGDTKSWGNQGPPYMDSDKTGPFFIH